jgi:hypothetical protein
MAKDHFWAAWVGQGWTGSITQRRKATPPRNPWRVSRMVEAQDGAPAAADRDVRVRVAREDTGGVLERGDGGTSASASRMAAPWEYGREQDKESGISRKKKE